MSINLQNSYSLNLNKLEKYNENCLFLRIRNNRTNIRYIYIYIYIYNEYLAQSCFECAFSEYHRYCSGTCKSLESLGSNSSCLKNWESSMKYSPNDVQFWRRTEILCTKDHKYCPSGSSVREWNTYYNTMPDKDETSSTMPTNEICSPNITIYDDSFRKSNIPMTVFVTIKRKSVF